MLPSFSLRKEFQGYINNNEPILKAKQLELRVPNSPFYNRIIWNTFISFLTIRTKAYNQRDNLVNHILEHTKLFISRYTALTRTFMKSNPHANKEKLEIFYRKIYGGVQCHILSAYHDNPENLNFYYQKPPKIVTNSQPTANNVDLNFISQIKNYNALSLDNIPDNVAYAACSNECRIPRNWGSRLHQLITKLNNAKCFNSIQRILLEMESCKN